MVDKLHLRAWWAARQGLDGSLQGSTVEEVFLGAGWSRSVGGCCPYLTAFARSGASREEVDDALSNSKIQELPSARGCTYILPSHHYPLGLRVGQGHGEASSIRMAKKFLGVTDLEIDTLCAAILTALRGAPLHPGQLKVAIGGAVRDLGAEGKRRGQATTLSLGLGKLQSEGKIRRIPVGGRIDQQRFSYALWDQIVDDSAEPFAKLAELFFTWIGPAHVREFQWFSGLGVATSRAAISELDLVDIGRGLLLPKGLTEEFFAFKVPIQPDVRLLSLLDSLFLLKRTFETLIDDPDIGNKIGGRGLSDLEYNVITDRGTIVGVWEYEQRSAQIAYHVFGPVESAHKEAVHRTEDYVRDQLGDARCYSLDSPESRQPKIEQIRAWN